MKHAVSTVAVEDCPREDVAAVVAYGPVSNRLVLYVRRMMAAERSARFDGVKPHEISRKDIASEVFEMCELEDHDEVGIRGAAWHIAAAAGWDYLSGRNTGNPSKAWF